MTHRGPFHPLLFCVILCDSCGRQRTQSECGWMCSGKVQSLSLLLLGELTNEYVYSQYDFRVSGLFPLTLMEIQVNLWDEYHGKRCFSLDFILYLHAQ